MGQQVVLQPSPRPFHVELSRTILEYLVVYIFLMNRSFEPGVLSQLSLIHDDACLSTGRMHVPNCTFQPLENMYCFCNHHGHFMQNCPKQIAQSLSYIYYTQKQGLLTSWVDLFKFYIHDDDQLSTGRNHEPKYIILAIGQHGVLQPSPRPFHVELP